ncbi:MAG: hypothetical protein ACREHV_15585 [Rhizomicrobium sp.]
MRDLKTAVDEALARKAADGKRAATQSTLPSMHCALSPMEKTSGAAAITVRKLFDWCRMPDDVGDPKTYLAGAVAIIAEYPPIVGEKLSDPRIGTRLLGDFPTLSRLRKACDEIFAPLAREAEREMAHQSHIAGLLPRPKRTPEQQARIDAQVTNAKRALAEASLNTAK